MRTPAGSECPYYFEDFHRGRQVQTCRLIEDNASGGRWAPELCARCPIPRITLANACPHMILEARVVSRLLGLRRGVEVSAYCTKSLQTVEEPEIGCGQCHEGFPAPLASQEEP